MGVMTGDAGSLDYSSYTPDNMVVSVFFLHSVSRK